MYMFLKARVTKMVPREYKQTGITDNEVETKGSQVSMEVHQKSRFITEEHICVRPDTPCTQREGSPPSYSINLAYLPSTHQLGFVVLEIGPKASHTPSVRATELHS